MKGSGSKSGGNRHFFHEVVEIMFQLLQMVVQVLTLFKKFFMFGKQRIVGNAWSDAVRNFPVVRFDGLLQIVNVAELDLKLVVVVFYMFKEVFGGLTCCGVLQIVCEVGEFVAVTPQLLPPGIALRRQL